MEARDDVTEVNSFATSFDCQPVDSEEESCNGTDSKSDNGTDSKSCNGTDSKSDSELSESESDVEREGLQEPPNTFGCESEMESGSDIDENQTESDSNAFMDSTETSFEFPMQHVDNFEPLPLDHIRFIKHLQSIITNNIKALDEHYSERGKNPLSDVWTGSVIQQQMIAKPTVICTKQFNGGPVCYHPGKRLPHGDRIYLPRDYSLRTHEAIIQDGTRAESNGNSVNGIVGVSPLAKILNPVNGIPIDDMHCAYEGIVKRLMSLWFESSNHTIWADTLPR
ncbi:hypothetical protein EMCRGX_G021486 [Ephydatia muelleri]